MTLNIHSFERGLRILVGIALISLAFGGPRNPWFLFGLVPLVTGLAGWCPAYALLGITTCPRKETLR